MHMRSSPRLRSAPHGGVFNRNFQPSSRGGFHRCDRFLRGGNVICQHTLAEKGRRRLGQARRANLPWGKGRPGVRLLDAPPWRELRATSERAGASGRQKPGEAKPPPDEHAHQHWEGCAILRLGRGSRGPPTSRSGEHEPWNRLRVLGDAVVHGRRPPRVSHRTARALTSQKHHRVIQTLLAPHTAGRQRSGVRPERFSEA